MVSERDLADLKVKLADRDRRIAELEAALNRVRLGYTNIIELRKLPNGRYGNLTSDEIWEVITEIDAALAGKGVSR